MSDEIDIIGDGYAAAAGNKTMLERRMIGMLNPQPDDVILDVGCGDGRVTQMIAGHPVHPKVAGIEIDSDLLEKARARGIDVYEVNAARLGEQKELAGKFTKVFSNLVLQWLKGEQAFKQAFAGMNKVLKMDGQMVLSFPSQMHPDIERAYVEALKNIGGLSEEEARGRIPIRHTEMAELDSLLRQSGFIASSLEIKTDNRHALSQGMGAWIENFLGPHMGLGEFEKQKVIAHMVGRLKQSPSLYDAQTNQWFIAADMFIVSASKQKELAIPVRSIP